MCLLALLNTLAVIPVVLNMHFVFRFFYKDFANLHSHHYQHILFCFSFLLQSGKDRLCLFGEWDIDWKPNLSNN